MSGLLNIAFPAFGILDGWLAVMLPAWLRVSIWGAVSGAVAMALYAMTSSQERLRAMKARGAELRAKVARTEDAGEAARLAFQNLGLSFRFLGAVLWPALLSGIPLLFVLAWVSAAYSLDMPETGRVVPITVEPPTAELEALPAAYGQRLAVRWPGEGTPVTLRESGVPAIEIPAGDLGLGVVHKQRWWNWLLGNKAGYLPDPWVTDSVRFELPAREVLPFGPSWMRGWAFTYFVSLIAVSVAIKIGFRIV